MLKKSLVLGAIAAMSMVSLAPAAFAGDQVQGNNTTTTIEAGVVGHGNRTNINNRTNVNQQQSKYKSPFRRGSGGNQIQGNTTDSLINGGVVGNRNRSRINNGTNINQQQRSVR